MTDPGAAGRRETADRYRAFARVEARGSSPAYERLALAVAQDGDVLELLDTVPPDKRQPNLLFGALRWHDVPVDDPAGALGWVRGHWPAVADVLRSRRTQTNEAARCATLLPALALLPQPLALVEVGASAGLCLLYDRWRYHYTGAGVDRWVGPADSPVTLPCRVTGAVPLPDRVPAISWRAGLDLDPVDAADPDARRWLQALVWPEHAERAERLLAALDLAAGRAAAVGPLVEAGDLVRDLPRVLARAPAEATLVVTHSSTLAYIDPAQREAFLAVLARAGAHRLGAEAPDALPHLAGQVPPGVEQQVAVSLDDRALGLAHPHGRDLTWL